MSIKERLFQPICTDKFHRTLLDALFLGITVVATLCFSIFVFAPTVTTSEILIALFILVGPACIVANMHAPTGDKNVLSPRLTPYACCGILSAMTLYIVLL